MTPKPILSNSDVAAMLSNYQLGQLQDAQPFAKGTVQTNLLITTTQGKLVLKVYLNRPTDSVRFEANLVHYLRQRDFPCAGALRNKQGTWVSLYQDKPLIIFEYIEGQHVDSLNLMQQKHVIDTAARLQIITRNYRPSLRHFRWNYTPELCLRLAQDAAHRLNTTTAHAKLKWFQQQLSALQLSRSLPKGICHCDYDLSNLLFRGDTLAALLDFDDANFTYLAFDLVVLMSWAWPFEGEFDPAAARQIAHEYQQTRPLSELEKRHLFDMQKLHILFDGIWYFARGDADDFYEKGKIEYLADFGRERFYRILFS
jgi:homoserine kinase type II